MIYGGLCLQNFCMLFYREPLLTLSKAMLLMELREFVLPEPQRAQRAHAFQSVNSPLVTHNHHLSFLFYGSACKWSQCRWEARRENAAKASVAIHIRKRHQSPLPSSQLAWEKITAMPNGFSWNISSLTGTKKRNCLNQEKVIDSCLSL